MTPPAPAHPAVLLLSGPSGSGKTRLAMRLSMARGWPVVRLDDFYLDAAQVPVGTLGIPDWDHVSTWDRTAARDALLTLCRTGRVTVPAYDIALSRRVGTRRVALGSSDVVVAEGVFAAHLIQPLAVEGLLLAGWCIRQRPTLTMGRRLARDLRSHRKPPLVLLRRGRVLRRMEPDIVAADVALGAVPLTPHEAEVQLASLRPVID